SAAEFTFTLEDSRASFMVPESLAASTPLIFVSATHPEQAADSESAADADTVRIEYGLDVICCRGVNVTYELVAGLKTWISTKRSAPEEKGLVPKFSWTVKAPF